VHEHPFGGGSLAAVAGEGIALEFLYFSRGAGRGEGAEHDTCAVSLQEKSRSRDGDQKRFAGDCCETVKGVHEGGGEWRRITEMPE